MKSISKAIVWLLLTILIAGLLSGCAKEEEQEQNSDSATTAAETTEAEESTTVGSEESTKSPDSVQTRPENPSASPVYEVTFANVHLYKPASETVWMQAIAEITNTGETSLSLDNATFNLKNEAGEIAATKGNVLAYPRVIASGEKGYFYIETPVSGVDADAVLTLVPEVEISKTPEQKQNLTVENTKLSTNTLGDLTVTGTVTNTTDKNYDTIYTVTVLFDDKDTPIGVIPSGSSYSLMAGEKKQMQDSAFALPDSITEKTVASFTVYAYAITAK